MTDSTGTWDDRTTGSACDLSTTECSSAPLETSSELSVHVDAQSIRAFLLKRNNCEPLHLRAEWKTNNGTYAAQREFLQLWTRGTMPGRAPDQEESDLDASAATLRAKSRDAQGQTCLDHHRLPGADAHPHGWQTDQAASALALQDMEVVVEGSEMPISVLKFAPGSSTLLAAGDELGQVRIIEVDNKESEVIQILEHNAGVSDLDWSQTHTTIVTCCEDGMVVLWGLAGEEGWECLRALEIVGSAVCCRFHPRNQNYVMVGSALGSVIAMNSTTGAVVSQYTLQTRAREGVFPSALTCSDTYTCVGDSRGHLVVLDSDISVLCPEPSMGLIYRSHPPTSERVPILSVEILPAANGLPFTEDEVMTYQADGCLCLWSLSSSDGSVLRILRKLKVMIPAPSRYTNAVCCPPGTCAEPGNRAVALGCLHPGVTVYDTGNLNDDQFPAALMQLQGPLTPVVALSWSNNNKILAAGDVDGSVILWRA